MAGEKTLGQQYYEGVEEQKAKGLTNADAIRAVAEQFGKSENAVRGSLHQYRSRSGGAPRSPGPAVRRRPRTSPQNVDELVAGARRSLEQAMQMLDREVDEAKAQLDAAQEHYDGVVGQLDARKSDIAKKLSAVS